MNTTPDIVTIEDDEFDNWYEGTPASTPNAEDLVGGQKPAGDTEAGKKKEEQPAPATPTVPVANPLAEIPTMDDDEVPDTDAPAAGAKKETKTTEAPAATTGNQPLKTPEGITDTYKTTVDYLIQSGQWVDFEGREDLELNDEVFAKLVEKQDEYRLNQRWEQKLKNVGPYGQAILEYEQNGGKAENLIDQFKAKNEAREFSIDTPDNQKAFIRNYYSELGWNKQRVDKHLQLLEMAGNEALEDHAKEIKTDYDQLYNSRIEHMKQQQEAYRAQQTEREQAYSASITKAIKERKDLSDKEKNYYIDLALNYDTPLPDGRMVNKAYVKFAQIQSDPVLYSRFLEFIDNPEKFSQKISAEEETKAAKKMFQFVAGGKTKKATEHIEASKPQPFSFKGAF